VNVNFPAERPVNIIRHRGIYDVEVVLFYEPLLDCCFCCSCSSSSSTAMAVYSSLQRDRIDDISALEQWKVMLHVLAFFTNAQLDLPST
jgi:hypothetical protein